MKWILLIDKFVLILFILLIPLAVLEGGRRTSDNSVVRDTNIEESNLSEFELSKPLDERESITFIMGEDFGEDESFFKDAKDYYLFNKDEKTDYLVEDKRTLLEVRDYLESNPPDNGMPWGIINLVSHSNKWTGLAFLIAPDSEKTNKFSLREAIDNGKIRSLSDGIIDSISEIRIQSCALGYQGNLLALIGEALGGENDKQRPIVRASYGHTVYTIERDGEKVLKCEKNIALGWYAVYKYDSQPSIMDLAIMLKDNNPGVPIDWFSALKRENPRWPDEPFRHIITIPLSWTVTYSNDNERPVLKTEQEKKEWLDSQEEFLSYIEKTGLPYDFFEWTISDIEYEWDDKTKEPAICAYGKIKVVSVLKFATKPHPQNPNRIMFLKPDLDDDRFYKTIYPK